MSLDVTLYRDFVDRRLVLPVTREVNAWQIGRELVTEHPDAIVVVHAECIDEAALFARVEELLNDHRGAVRGLDHRRGERRSVGPARGKDKGRNVECDGTESLGRDFVVL